MQQYKNILVATDGSEYSMDAVKHAVSIAKATGAKLTVLYVVSTFVEPRRSAPAYNGLKKIFREEGKKAVEKAKEIAKQEGIGAEAKILEGIPFEVIVEAAKEEKADLIVMGSHGHTGINKVLLGSVAERVIRRAPCAVTVVRRKE